MQHLKTEHFCHVAPSINSSSRPLMPAETSPLVAAADCSSGPRTEYRTVTKSVTGWRSFDDLPPPLVPPPTTISRSRYHRNGSTCAVICFGWTFRTRSDTDNESFYFVAPSAPYVRLTTHYYPSFWRLLYGAPDFILSQLFNYFLIIKFCSPTDIYIYI